MGGCLASPDVGHDSSLDSKFRIQESAFASLRAPHQSVAPVGLDDQRTAHSNPEWPTFFDRAGLSKSSLNGQFCSQIQEHDFDG